MILLNGDVGRHGMAIMSVREGLEFETAIVSDCAPLNGAVQALLDAGIEIHCLRDLTRGGLTAGLNEIARDGGVAIEIEENSVPVEEQVRGACEILGLDPFYVANEGRFIALIPAKDADRARAVLKSQSAGETACRIGRVSDGPAGQVTMVSRIGARRMLDLLSGEQLPRIC
jgi:hydrogenase expression/formation protein HypE